MYTKLQNKKTQFEHWENHIFILNCVFLALSLWVFIDAALTAHPFHHESGLQVQPRAPKNTEEGRGDKRQRHSQHSTIKEFNSLNHKSDAHYGPKQGCEHCRLCSSDNACVSRKLPACLSSCHTKTVKLEHKNKTRKLKGKLEVEYSTLKYIL